MVSKGVKTTGAVYWSEILTKLRSLWSVVRRNVKRTTRECSIHTNKCTVFLWCRFIIRYPPTCFGYLCGHLQGGINKNTFKITDMSKPLHLWK